MEDNIFEASKKQSRSGKNKASQDEVLSGLIKKTEGTQSFNELNAMLQKMQMMKKDLEDQLAEIYRNGKESKINAVLLVENANNLTAKQLEKVEQQERILIEKINAIIPPEACLKKTPKSKEKLTQERKNKMRGARSNWIPMR